MPYNEKLTNRIRDTLARTHNRALRKLGWSNGETKRFRRYL